MAASPQYKIYQGSDYLGSLKRPSDAAALLSVLGPGSSVRLGHAKRDTLHAVTEENQETYDLLRVETKLALIAECICIGEKNLKKSWEGQR
tara:strand:- start:21 stop:293 length:273 start_codon:yes stop_codon:yes gene_type:complete